MRNTPREDKAAEKRRRSSVNSPEPTQEKKPNRRVKTERGAERDVRRNPERPPDEELPR